ncbi:MAG: plasmid mobilization relaxosome protein MobC [Phyllobacterium sp.]|uniref:plasmid mobilization protein n=1 Tax=Phyllobacterium sp. TaxID=1871046 RepID=UPI0030F02E78
MKHLSTNIDDDLAERFSELARAHGGKSALLRHLVSLAVDGPSPQQTPTLPEPAGRAVHLSVRLSANEVAEVRKAAAARGMKPSQWLRSVVRVRLGAGTQYNASEVHALRALTNQVRRIGVNLNQLVRAANEARLENAPFTVDNRVLETTREKAERTLTTLHVLARGNVRVWEGHADGE